VIYQKYASLSRIKWIAPHFFPARREIDLSMTPSGDFSLSVAVTARFLSPIFGSDRVTREQFSLHDRATPHERQKSELFLLLRLPDQSKKSLHMRQSVLILCLKSAATRQRTG